MNVADIFFYQPNDFIDTINIWQMYTLRESKKKTKKYDLITPDKTISFGARGMSDYTIHHDKARK